MGGGQQQLISAIRPEMGVLELHPITPRLIETSITTACRIKLVDLLVKTVDGVHEE